MGLYRRIHPLSGRGCVDPLTGRQKVAVMRTALLKAFVDFDIDGVTVSDECHGLIVNWAEDPDGPYAAAVDTKIGASSLSGTYDDVPRGTGPQSCQWNYAEFRGFSPYANPIPLRTYSEVLMPGYLPEIPDGCDPSEEGVPYTDVGWGVGAEVGSNDDGDTVVRVLITTDTGKEHEEFPGILLPYSHGSCTVFLGETVISKCDEPTGIVVVENLLTAFYTAPGEVTPDVPQYRGTGGTVTLTFHD